MPFRRWSWIALAAMACDQEVIPDRDDSDDGPITCADPIEGLAFTITGLVERATGEAAAGATVRLEDIAGRPSEVFGETTTDDQGAFTLSVTEVVWWPDCSGLFTDYEVVAEGTGGATGSRDINFNIFKALDEDTTAIDIRARPVTLE